jgi:hypothetical protein
VRGQGLKLRKAIVLVALPAAIAGCQGQPVGGTANPSPAQPAATSASDAPKTPISTAVAPVDPAHPETKWIGTIPYDVFYDQPLKVASDATAVAVVTTETPATAAPGSATPANPPPTESPGSTEAPSTTAAPGEVDWAKVVPTSVLVDETKQIRVRLEKNLQKVGDYNKNIEAIAQDGAVLAGIAMVAQKHPEPPNWKDKAGHIRDFAGQVYMKAEGTGSKPFNATKAPFEEIKKLLDGEPASGEAPAEATFGETADRGALMKRLSATYDSLKSNVNSAGRLKEEASRTQHDLAMMTLLMTIMADPSYDRADDPRYVAFVQTIVGQQKEAAEAAAADNFDSYSATMGKINNTCNECHMLFRTGSE